MVPAAVTVPSAGIACRRRPRDPGAPGAGRRGRVAVLLQLLGRTDGRGLRAEPVDVGAVHLLPALDRGPRRLRAIEVMRQLIEAGVPPGDVAGRLAELLERVEQGQRRPRT